MINGFWGRKVGMTQVFTADNKVVPVTAVDASGWWVSQVKVQENDGYNAIQVAYLREKLQSQPFQMDWLKQKSKHFRWVREIALEQLPTDIQVGQQFDFSSIVQPKDDHHLLETIVPNHQYILYLENYIVLLVV